MTAPGGLTTTGFQAETSTDVQTSIQNDEAALIDPALSFNPAQPLGQLNGLMSGNMANLWSQMQAVYQGAIDPATATGIPLDNLCALTGMTRLSATATLVSATCVFGAGQTYAAGALTANITGSPQYTFTNLSAIPSTAGGAQTVVFQCTQTGPIPCASGALSTITTAVGGWTSITNALAGTLGGNVETDTALRARRLNALAAQGGGTTDSIRTTLLAVPGIINAFVIENNTDAVDFTGTLAHSFQVIIWDGVTPLASNNAIAQAIWNTKPAGIRPYGNTSGSALDSAGAGHLVFFTRVTALPIYVTIGVRVTDVGAFNAAGGPALVTAQIETQMAALPPGATAQQVLVNGVLVPQLVSNAKIFVSQFFAAPFQVPGVGIIAVDGITMDVVNPPLASFDITPSIYQYPVLGNCTVNASVS